MYFLLILFQFFSQFAFGQTTPLDFQAALQEISQRNPDIASQSAELNATESRNLSKKLFYLPDINIEARQEDSRSGSNSPTSSTSLVGRATLNLFRFGADWSSYQAALQQEQQQELLRLQQIFLVENQGAKAVFGFLEQEMIVSVLGRDVEIREESLKIAQQRYKKGLLAQEEVDKVAIDRHNAVSRRADARILTIQQQQSLIELLGHDQVQKVWPWKDKIIDKDSIANLFGSDPQPLLSRPDLRAANALVSQTEQDEAASFRGILPTLDADASYGYSKSTAALSQNSAFQPSWSVGISINIPLFDRLTRISQYREKVWIKEKADQQRIKATRNAQKQWTQAKDSFLLARDTALEREETRKIAEKLYQANLKRFRQGHTKANDLALDETRLIEASQLAIQGWANAHRYLLDLCHALGKRVESCFAL